MEPRFTKLFPLVRELAKSLHPFLNLPFAFFGHSLGALICFELARQLRRQNDPDPYHLFISAYRAPQLPNHNPPLHQLPDAEFIKRLRDLNGTPEAVLQNEGLLQMLLPLLRADFAILETYEYVSEALLTSSISVFGGLQDSIVSQDHLAAWRDQTNNTFTLHMLPGDHFFLHDAQSDLLQVINRELVQLAQIPKG